MYNITDNTKYYFYDLMYGYYIEFENEEELIEEIAKGFYFQSSIFDWYLSEEEIKQKRLNPLLWNNIYFEKLNLDGVNYFEMTKEEICKLLNWNIDLFNEMICYKRFLFLDSNGRIIDIRKYKNEAIKLCIANDWLDNKRFWYNGIHILLRKKKTKKQYRAFHNSKNFRSKNHFNTKRTTTYNSVREYREFVRGRDKMLETTCFEFNKQRIISCSWKDQTKDRKQWMHNAKRTTFN